MKKPRVAQADPRAKMLAKLKESSLTAEDAKALCLRPFNQAQSTRLNLMRAGDGFLIPYFAPDGRELPMFRYRFFDVEQKSGFLKGAKQPKYAQPLHTDPEVYFPRIKGVEWLEIVSDPSVSLVITEGELKSACATKMGYTTIGVGGVYNFAATKKGQALIPSMQQIEWRGRDVFICYDSDAITNRLVVTAEVRLARTLTDAGAFVRVVRLPSLPKTEKTGINDFLAAEGKEKFENLLNQTESFIEFQELHRLNTEVIYVKHPSMVAEYPLEDHPQGQPKYRMMKCQTFTNEAFADRKYRTMQNDKPVEHRAAKEWMEWSARSVVDSVVYEPGKPVIMNRNQMNLWQGWGAEPKQGDVSLFVKLFDNMMKNALPEHRKWLLQWLAYPIQNPGAKMNTAIVMWGIVQGSGKSLLGYTMGKVYGANFSEATFEAIQGSFNAWSVHKQFVMGEEITGGSGRDVADMLKNMITGKDITVNEKYVPAYNVRNCINYYFTSNHQDAFFMQQHDRRLFVHEVIGPRLSDDFFAEYDKWFHTKEAAAALHHYFLEVDLTGFNPNAEAPETQAKKEMVDAGRSEHTAWCVELLRNPDNVLRLGDAVIEYDLFTVEDLLAIYAPATDLRRKPVSPKAMSIALREIGFERCCYGEPVELGKRKRGRVWAVRNKGKYDAKTVKQIGEMYQAERSTRQMHREDAPKFGKAHKQR